MTKGPHPILYVFCASAALWFLIAVAVQSCAEVMP